MTKRILTLSLFLLLALGLMAAPLQAKPASSGLDADVLRELAQVRRATAQYQDVAAAEAAGYVVAKDDETEEPQCVPNMGYHYLLMGDFGLAIPGPGEGAPDALEPNILVYAPRPNGSLQLVAVEYATFDDDAKLFGQDFAPGVKPVDGELPAGPPFATLHAWVWNANPSGMFAPYNPKVSC